MAQSADGQIPQACAESECMSPLVLLAVATTRHAVDRHHFDSVHEDIAALQSACASDLEAVTGVSAGVYSSE
jgi:hypothetical protein